MALLHREGKIVRLQIGEATSAEAKRHLEAAVEPDGWTVRWGKPGQPEQGWINELQKYSEGKPTKLDQLPVDESGMTDFQRRVRAACRKIPRGQVRTYGELAEQVQRPGSARAVGTVMSRNPTPLLMPCHRVLGSNGLGGYSAPQGIAMKLHLLEMEGAIEFCDCGQC